MSHFEGTYPLVNLALARRLERTEASANAAFVAARGQLQPESGATWTEVAGAYAMFDGVGSPLTQTFGLGLFAEAGEAEFAALEAFFHERGAEVFHEISPLAAPALLPHLNARGYLPIEFTSLMFQPVAAALAAGSAVDGLRVRRIGADEAEVWASVAAEGWRSESPDLVPFVREMGKISARAEGTFCFLAELDGQPVAAGGLFLSDGTALLAGASTIPAARRKGCTARPAASSPALCRRAGLRPGDDRCAAGERVAAQRGAAGLSHCLHPHQVAPFRATDLTPILTFPAAVAHLQHARTRHAARDGGVRS